MRDIITVGTGNAEAMKKLKAGIPSLRIVRLDPDSPENKAEYVDQVPGLNFRDFYAVIGEVARIDHYLILNYGTGQVLPGMFHLERFMAVPDEDL